MTSFTCSGQPEAEEFVASQIATIVNRIRAEDPGVSAIFLVGSFGRGEGGVEETSSGFKAVNDYDFVILDERSGHRKALHELGQELAAELGVDFVDLGIMDPSSLAVLKPTVFNYDLKYASRALVGDPELLDQIPPFKPSDIPPWEGLRLLFNRIAGLMGAVERRPGGTELEASDPSYLKNQIIKGLVACGDALLISQEQYHHSCSARRERLAPAFEALGNEGRDHHDLVERAYREKVRPNSVMDWDLSECLVAVLQLLRSVFVSVASIHLGRSVATPEEAVVRYLRSQRTGWRSRVLTWTSPGFGVSSCDAAFASVALVAFSAPVGSRSSGSSLIHARRVLSRVEPRLALSFGEGAWERLRKASVEQWERHCHG